MSKLDHMSTYELWLKSVWNDNEKEELKKYNESDIKEYFSHSLSFGTAGMRGEIGYGTSLMNIYNVMRATRGVAQYIEKALGEEGKKRGVVISYDTRLYSYEFALASAKVLSFYKIKSYLFEDVRPVPVCSFAIRHLNAAMGIMITASHNPKEYNGYKVYGADGAQLDPISTEGVVKYINEIQGENYFKKEIEDVKVDREKNVKNKDSSFLTEYIEIIGERIDKLFYEKVLEQQLSKDSVERMRKNLKIIYTPIHGTGYIPVSHVFDIMGLNYLLVEEQKNPDVNFSTVKVPNPEQEEVLSMGIELAKKENADVVIGTDPDCDRMGVAIKIIGSESNLDGQFMLLNGNQIGTLLMQYELERRKELNILPDNAAVVKTIVTTNLAGAIAKSYNVSVYDVLTGFKFIGEKIKEWESNGKHKFIFGFEESYGYLAGTHARDKDAVVAAMLFADMTCYYKDKGFSLYQILQRTYKKYGYFVEYSKSITFKGLQGMDKMANIMKTLVSNPYNKISNYDVDAVMDFNAGITYYSNGSMEDINLPQSNVIKYILNDKEWVCIRPSGTESKLKIYASVLSETAESAKNKANSIVDEMINKINKI